MPLGRRKEIYQDGLISRYYVSHRLKGRQFLFSSFDLFSHCMWCAIWGVGLHQDGARKYVSQDSLQRDQSIWDSEDAGCNWKGGWDAPWRDKEDGGGGTSLWSSLHVEVQGSWKSHKQVPSRPTLRVVSRCRWCGTQFKELEEGLPFFYFLKGDFEPLTGEYSNRNQKGLEKMKTEFYSLCDLITIWSAPRTFSGGFVWVWRGCLGRAEPSSLCARSAFAASIQHHHHHCYQCHHCHHHHHYHHHGIWRKGTLHVMFSDTFFNCGQMTDRGGGRVN